MNTPRKLALVLACATLAMQTAPVFAGGAQGSEAEPNLVARPPSYLQIGRPDDAGEPGDTRTGLRFSATIANLGDEAFEFSGIPEGPDRPDSATAYQCVTFVSRVCIEREPRGRLSWHPQHQHFHIDAFASYQIHELTPDGLPDLASAPLASSPKVSFCLMDSSREHEPEPFELNIAFYNTCTMAFQGISKGWGDVYDYDLPGQFLSLDAITDGRYALVLIVDPLKQFRQSTVDDDIAWTVFTLSDGGATIKLDVTETG